MTKLLQVGMSSAGELHHQFGHIACTLGGVNYESRGSKGCLRGSAARGATNPLFRHTFHLVLPDASAAEAKAYADSCVGQPYILGRVPTKNRGGDCSGYVSGIICAARGKPLMRLFSTATWPTRFDDADLGFVAGLGGGVAISDISAIGVPDRPFPGREFTTSSPRSDHVKWIQSRLNCAAKHSTRRSRINHWPRTDSSVRVPRRWSWHSSTSRHWSPTEGSADDVGPAPGGSLTAGR